MLLVKADQTVFKSFSWFRSFKFFSCTYFIKLLMIQRFSVIKMLQKCFPTLITWEEADQSFLNFEAFFFLTLEVPTLVLHILNTDYCCRPQTLNMPKTLARKIRSCWTETPPSLQMLPVCLSAAMMYNHICCFLQLSFLPPLKTDHLWFWVSKIL